MAAITAAMVGELRAKTDAPMMECKKALTEAEGDMARAEEILRVKLGGKASKASSRVTAEGVVAAYISGNVGALVEGEIFAKGAAPGGLNWHFCRPPVAGLDYEMDVRGVSQELTL